MPEQNALHTIENENILLSFDAKGNLHSLTNKLTGHDYAGGKPVWRLYFQRDAVYDCEIVYPDKPPRIERTSDTMTLSWNDVTYQGKAMKIVVNVTVSVHADETYWSIHIANNEAEINVRECQFPLVGGIQIKPAQELLWSQHGGERIADIRTDVKRRHSAYMASDHLFVGMNTMYPGRGAATNCWVLADDTEGIYFGCHDASFTYTGHSFRLYGEDLESGFFRYPSIAAGQSATIENFIIAPYRGTWHAGVKRYRTWADSWYRHGKVPAWTADMNGWQRIILKHQYGEQHYRYDQLPQIHHDGMAAGINTLFMFGWWQGGMDNSNPEYVAADDLGGDKELAKGIKYFRDNGGNVILYSNGKLIDTTTKFYKEIGKRIAIKDMLGNEIHEVYRFRGRGTFYGNNADRTFAVACPSSEEWFKVLTGIVDTAKRIGCSGVFFDQIGMGDIACCDPTHGHPVPFMNIMQEKARLTERLRAYVKKADPDMAFGIEWLCDCTAQDVDFIHSLGGYCVATNDWAKTGEKPRSRGFIDFFRYLFPEIIVSDREIRDDTDIERRLNHAVQKGLHSDVEIYRCRKTIAETPHYQARMTETNKFRQRQSALLLRGTYIDTTGFTCDNPDIDARAFVNGDMMGVVICQSHKDSITAKIKAPGYVYSNTDGVGNAVTEKIAGDTIQVTVRKNDIAMLIFKRAV
ncbi:MAG: hypothetical protein HZC28_14605 [Spirochaetes bacterium]|nr:hypothetical protein [Spirochaetota bacterium]